MLNAGWRIFSRLEMRTPMCGYDNLDVLKQLSLLLFLVTSGFRHLQESKFRAPGLPPVFKAVYVDAFDEPDRKGKQERFVEIPERYRSKPEETLVIGDNTHSKIAAGNRPGMSKLRPPDPMELR